MSEKKPWHDPKFQLLDASATAGDPATISDDFGADDPVAPNPPDSGNLHDHSNPAAADFS